MYLNTLGKRLELILKDRVRSTDIRRELGVELLLLFHQKLSGHLPLQVFWASPTGRRYHLPHLSWERLPRISQEELENTGGERDVWTTLLSILPL